MASGAEKKTAQYGATEVLNPPIRLCDTSTMSNTFNQLVAAAEAALVLQAKANRANEKSKQALAAANRAEADGLPKAERERLVSKASKATNDFIAVSKQFQAAAAKTKRLFDRVVDQKTAEKLVAMGHEEHVKLAFRD